MPNITITPEHVKDLLATTHDAGVAIMQVYQAAGDIAYQTKSDNTPVTEADTAAHNIIVPRLEKAFPDIPVVSEEGDQDYNRALVTGGTYWAVDPLDGTKEFLKRTGDFAVCLALVEDGVPIFGIVSAPAHDVVYYGGHSMGSFKVEATGQPRPIKALSHLLRIVLGSRNDQNGPTANYIREHYPDYEVLSVGSQLKLPYIAEGRADVYPRINGPLHLWDLAPGQAILEGAGGSVLRPDGSAIDYRTPTLLAGDFVAYSAAPRD